MLEDQVPEEWRPIIGWSYEVSNLGRVRRATDGPSTKAGRVMNPSIVKLGRGKVPYRSVILSGGKRGIQKRCLVHRLVCEAFHGPAPQRGMDVAHGDGDSLHNAANNLRWSTRAENEGDKVIHGRSNRGERQWNSKLTTKDILTIRKMASEGKRRADLARMFSVNHSTITRIVGGKRWSWLSGTDNSLR